MDIQTLTKGVNIMNAKDLKKGSVVLYANTPVVITNIFPSTYEVTDRNKNKYTAYINQLEPINICILLKISVGNVVENNGTFFFLLENSEIKIGRSSTFYNTKFATHIIQNQYQQDTQHPLDIILNEIK